VISYEHVSKTYADAERPAVDDFTLDVPGGCVCVLIGPSGCGKSTTLRMANRLIDPDAGSVKVDGADVRELGPEQLRRRTGYAIQGVGLFPHWTVHDNIAVVPRLLKWETREIDARVAELLDLVGLEPAAYDAKYPDELSGGEAQRVGVARALAADPPVLLMDEPFGAVDPLTRDKLQTEFLSIQERLHKTVLFVTHDMDEAVKLGDRITVMRQGRLVQSDTPERVLAYPADEFVAGFVGDERALKRLSLAPIAEALGPASEATESDISVPLSGHLREALGKILELGVPAVLVADENGRIVGSVSVETIVARFRKPLA
jgi:osmoprotectant transport system ATP-binding protein